MLFVSTTTMNHRTADSRRDRRARGVGRRAILAAGLIALTILGFIVTERGSDLQPKPDRDRSACETENVTDIQVHDCMVKRKMRS